MNRILKPIEWFDLLLAIAICASIFLEGFIIVGVTYAIIILIATIGTIRKNLKED